MRLPDTVAETVEITHRRGLCPKQSVPLFLGSGALKLDCTPQTGGVVTFKRTFPKITGLNPALRVNRAPLLVGC
ncbi:hypothetical protein [Nostoc sp. UHCC 0252]|uniref:hypothetical protein n=1 Tax=Nostoc sp. UHCC 0252 TaxID=3110241 RepID=UPI002B200FC9|nr:hypothetical protein [Nostoc sp. UHCC 0252]MEA5601054.1 hypothetical protein [Nostoc sp. UHCC 0252]